MRPMDESKPTPTPYELWQLSGKNLDVYSDLLVKHGLAKAKNVKVVEEPGLIQCMLVISFRGQQLRLFEAKKLPALPNVGDLIDGHEVLGVRSRGGSIPMVFLLWSKDRETSASKASIPPGRDGSSPP